MNNTFQIKSLIIVASMITTSLFANDMSLDNILLNIEKKTDLSQKTKLANSGISFIYTRDDINRMQITNLADILKSTYPVGYDENRYGLPDPIYLGTNTPYVSSQIRVYIDNQEITSGMYGSGLASIGNLNIDWVDHIEIYTQSPTYEYATESTITLIKLYSKSAQRDEGGKIKVGGGSYGASIINAYYAHELHEWSYFAFVSREQNKRKKYSSGDTQISRDNDRSFLIGTLSNKNNNILLIAQTENKDAFLGVGMTGSPKESKLNADFIHIGYDATIKNFSYLLSYEYFNLQSFYLADVTPIQMPPYNGLFPTASNDTYTHTHTFTGELKYKFTLDLHRLVTGLKYREKRYNFDKAEQNGIDISESPNNKQTTATAYIEDQYHMQPNAIITAGVEYSKVNNNGSPQNDNMFMYRLGYTFTNEFITAKTIASHTLTTLDPYLINSNAFLASPTSYHKPQTYNALVEDIIYETENNKYEIIIDYTRIINYLVPNQQGKLTTYEKSIDMCGFNGRYTYKYNRFDKVFFSMEYRQLSNLPITIGTYKRYVLEVRTLNSFGKFDIFNELLYSKNNIDKENAYDYSAGIKYNYSKDLIASIKGVNLFDKAQKTSYYRTSPVTFQPMEPFRASPIDRKVMMNLEYFF